MTDEVLHVILLDLHKVYDTLDRSMLLDILELYGVGTTALRLLRMYGERIHMVARTRGVLNRTLLQIDSRDAGRTIVSHNI